MFMDLMENPVLKTKRPVISLRAWGWGNSEAAKSFMQEFVGAVVYPQGWKQVYRPLKQELVGFQKH